MIGVIAATPGYGAALTVRNLVGLTLKASLIDAVFADCAVLDSDVPAP